MQAGAFNKRLFTSLPKNAPPSDVDGDANTPQPFTKGTGGLLYELTHRLSYEHTVLLLNSLSLSDTIQDKKLLGEIRRSLLPQFYYSSWLFPFVDLQLKVRTCDSHHSYSTCACLISCCYTGS
jgi:hypothetical protein